MAKTLSERNEQERKSRILGGRMAKTEKVRLNKYLSETGICSRREADRLIEEGKVTVNGKTAEPGMKVNDLDKIMVGEKPAARREKKVVLAYYKPVGVTCTERTVMRRLRLRTRWTIRCV